MSSLTPALVPSGHGTSLDVASVRDHLASAAVLAGRALSAKTLDAYRADWSRFVDYCRRIGVDPNGLGDALARDVVALVVAHLGQLATGGKGAKASTLNRAAAGIRWGLAVECGRTDEPTRDRAVRDVLRGARRDPGRKSTGARAVGLGDVAAMLSHVGSGPAGVRDRALILCAFAGAFRRGELVALDVDHVADDGQTITLTIERSKTDQEGRGRFVVLHSGASEATCPVSALRAWLEVRGCKAGPLFVAIDRHGCLRSGRLTAEGFRLVLARAAAAAGVSDVKPHGLRAGHVTEARRRGATAAQVRQVTGHVDERMISHYTRAIDAADNSARHLGL
ncbi:MAG: tyrosine-type recombinase/integrase [Actinobacteria bacterium]|uniref:Unannotated protein n=1 Tax=freshwater metagenome TaxID=449393 RepID=A0A6J6F3X6_9ZZZZ|nr:tyrosine-type recombinase/integrase [Actinomycetota bacterium]